MFRFANLRISTQLLIVSALSLICLATVGIWGLLGLKYVSEQSEIMYVRNFTKLQLANEALSTLQNIAILAPVYAIYLDETYFSTNMEQYEAFFADLLVQYETLVVNEQEKEMFEEAKKAYIDYIQAAKTIVSASTTEEAAALGNQLQPKRVESVAAFEELVEYNTNQAQMRQQSNTEQYLNIRLKLITAVIIGFTFSFIASLSLSRTMSQRLGILSHAAGQIASGDLTGKPLEPKGKDEIAQVAVSFNQMSRNLKELLFQINNASESIAASSEETSASTEQTSQSINQVAEASQELAQGAEKQRHEVQETTATVQEFSAGIEEISATVQQLAGNAEENVAQTKKGRAIMDQAAMEMERINQATQEIAQIISELGHRSQAIGQIVELISGIADQTNLLALNAAIEAARAGDQGRGFAVVAEEVRKLAEQSQSAAKEIADLISQIQADTSRAVTAMDNNTAVVAKGGEVITTGAKIFQEIEEIVEASAQQLQQVAASTEELSKGAEEILRAVQIIDSIATQVESAAGDMAAGTEEQAAAMEEIAASAESLASLGQELQRIVGQFRLAHEQ